MNHVSNLMGVFLDALSQITDENVKTGRKVHRPFHILLLVIRFDHSTCYPLARLYIVYCTIRITLRGSSVTKEQGIMSYDEDTR